ncbi:hypothetical protein [Streptomyces sp. NPDC057748]
MTGRRRSRADAGRTVRQQFDEREGSVNSSPVAVQDVLLQGDEEWRRVI